MIRRRIYKDREFDSQLQADAWITAKEEQGWRVRYIKPVLGMVTVSMYKLLRRRRQHA